MRALRRGQIILAVLFALVAAPAAAARGTVEVVVTLKQPSLAYAAKNDRAFASVTTSKGRVNLRSPSSLSYIDLLRSEQDAVGARIANAIPGAFVHWRYSITLNGLAVVVPTGKVAALARIPGVAKVWSSVTYHSSLDSTPQLIGAPVVWGPTLATAGQGMKIGIIDEGVDQTHPFLSPAGFTMPAGYPLGDTTFTTAKVIVARAFPPARPAWKYANLPFDPENSEHGTHVAGIAAGDHGTVATSYTGSPTLSGIAPAAYIGNYKALTIPTPGVGLDGNAAEIAKAIDQAVQDGMDVINLSIGEPEIEPSRDIVVQALNGAAAAGVVPVVAAGNDFDDFGRGSIGSPGDASGAITVAAATGGHRSTPDIIAGFSSSGPTPYSLQLKPDVTAPGTNVLSSVPAREGLWQTFNGTSMATPHVAGAAALLLQRHPSWTVAQVKSALAQTGVSVRGTGSAAEVSPLREGGGRIDLVHADNPLLFAAPSSLSFGMLRPGANADLTVALSDAGGGAGAWAVTVSNNAVSAPAAVTVPGSLVVHAAVAAGSGDSDSAGFVVLTRGTDIRRIPFWLHVENPVLGAPARTLLKTGTYSGDASKGRSLVDSYRFPEPPSVRPLSGPEQVFAYKVTASVANIGARIVSQSPGVKVTPRVVRDGDENRLAGYTALPIDLNPYRDLFGRDVPVVGAILPGRGTYDVVFDTASKAEAGRFVFRFWVNDVTAPTVKMVGYNKRGTVTLKVTDAGSGVDPASLSATVDGVQHNVSFAGGRAVIASGTLARGSHTVVLVASDYQESKNMEDVARILPNTRTFTTSLKLR